MDDFREVETSQTSIFYGKNYKGAKSAATFLKMVDLEYCDLSGASIDCSYYLQCSFSSCSFFKTTLTKLVSRLSQFQCCAFSFADMESSAFSNCLFSECYFCYSNLKKSRFLNCTFDRCVFSGCDMDENTFADCSLGCSTFTNCNGLVL